MPRRACWSLLFLSLGCQSLSLNGNGPDRAAAEQHWSEGQVALQEGHVAEAISDYEKSLTFAPERPQTLLSLAAAELEKGDEPAACQYLGRYLAARPNDLKARAYYAELLLRLRHTPAARAEYERFDADAQDRPGSTSKQLVHCHSRLAKIAVEQGDEYAEHLHRGIGLYLLGQARSQLPDPEGEFPAEGLMCKAADELTNARLRKPDEARPCWYLYAIWSRLGQSQPAQAHLRAATDAAPFSYLTPSEKRQLELASRIEDRSRN